MRRSLVLLAVLAAAAIGVFCATGWKLRGAEEAVFVTEERRVGDPAAAEGLVVEMRTNSTGHLHWTTTVTLGQTLDTAVEYHFTGKEDYIQDPVDPYCYLYGGINTSYSGRVEDFSEFGPAAEMAADVAGRTESGETRKETVDCGDYWTYLPVFLDSNLYDWPWDGLGSNGLWPDAGDFLQIPAEGSAMEIQVWKEADATTQVELNLDPRLEVSGTSVLVDGGIYLGISLLEQGQTVAAGKVARGGSIYYLPVDAAADGEGYQVRTDGIREIWSSDAPAEIRRMVLLDDQLLLVCRSGQGGTEEGTLVETGTGRARQTLTLPVDGSYSSWGGDGYFVTFDETQRLAVLTLDGDGLLQPCIDADVSPAQMGNLYDPRIFFDGERILLASYLDNWNNPSVDLAVCSPEGLLYGARLVHSQAGDDRSGDRCRPDGKLILR